MWIPWRLIFVSRCSSVHTVWSMDGMCVYFNMVPNLEDLFRYNTDGRKFGTCDIHIFAMIPSVHAHVSFKDKAALGREGSKLGFTGYLIKGKLGSVSFMEMTTSQLQGKLWLYDEVRTRLCLFCHHQIGEDCWDSRFDETK
ncbi:hypothetical protein Tco_0018952 [Tanacetum coccineum]